MNVLVVCYSEFGNTRKVDEAIAEVLKQAGSARVMGVDHLTPTDLNRVDLLVAGSPTHRMNLPAAVRKVFGRLTRKTLMGTTVAAFDTSYQMSRWLTPFTAAKKLVRKLRKMGGKQIVPPETFHAVGKALCSKARSNG